MTNIIELTQSQMSHDDTRAALRSIVDNDGMTYTAISREAGLSSTAVSHFMNEKYKGDNDDVNPITNQVEGKTTGAEMIVMSPAAKVISFNLRISPNTEEVRQSVKASLKNYLDSLPPGGLAYLSEMRAAISNAPGEVDNTVYSPTSDIQANENEIFILGDIVWR